MTVGKCDREKCLQASARSSNTQKLYRKGNREVKAENLVTAE